MRTVDLTQGSIPRKVAMFALPLLGTSAIQQLYGTVDLLFVGNVLGTRGAAALGVGSLLITCLIGLFSGISVGANVRVARRVGVGDEDGAIASSRSAAVLGLAGGLLLVIAGGLLARPFADWMAVPPEALQPTIVYLRFAVAAALPIALYNVCAGALRGWGDSRSPLVAQVIGGGSNIAANWLTLCVLGWGIAGCALATFLSNGVAALIAIRMLRRHWSCDDAATRTSDKGFARFCLTFGLPIGVQTLAITISNVFVQHQVDLLGVEAVAAFAIYLKVELPIYYSLLAIGQATTTFVAQNAGAGNWDRCREGERVCQLMCIVLTIALSVVMLGVGYWAFWLFDRTETVVLMGLSMIQVTFPFYFLYAILEVQADALRGYGRSLAPAVIILANICVLRVILVLAFGADGTSLPEIALTYPITWLTTAIVLLIYRRK